MQVVIFSSPGREGMLKGLLNELKGMSVEVIDDPSTFGKMLFWKRYNQAIDICLNSPFDDYLILPDDVTSLDLVAVRRIADRKKGQIFTCNVINDGREACWGARPHRPEQFNLPHYNIKEVNFFDCGGVTNRATLSRIKLTRLRASWYEHRTSSGVGFQITKQIRKLKGRMYTPSPSMCHHGDHESIMHPDERKRNPLISKGRMKVVIGIATMPGREDYLKKTLKCLAPQADQIRIYHNGERDIDYTDNGKFYFLQEYNEPIYYFSCDDDIIYPPTYVQDTIKAIERLRCIVTYHGRILRRRGVSYYRGGHRAFRCTGLVNREHKLHVAGTGVTAFRTDYFNPSEIYKSEDQKMSDLVFSLEAAKQNKTIKVLTHDKGYLVAQPVPNEQTIFGTHRGHDARQSEIADEILTIRP